MGAHHRLVPAAGHHGSQRRRGVLPRQHPRGPPDQHHAGDYVRPNDAAPAVARPHDDQRQHICPFVGRRALHGPQPHDNVDRPHLWQRERRACVVQRRRNGDGRALHRLRLIRHPPHPRVLPRGAGPVPPLHVHHRPHDLRNGDALRHVRVVLEDREPHAVADEDQVRRVRCRAGPEEQAAGGAAALSPRVPKQMPDRNQATPRRWLRLHDRALPLRRAVREVCVASRAEPRGLLLPRRRGVVQAKRGYTDPDAVHHTDDVRQQPAPPRAEVQGQVPQQQRTVRGDYDRAGRPWVPSRVRFREAICYRGQHP
eukprot:PhM_4_TR15929/c0_g2_i1/m.54523